MTPTSSTIGIAASFQQLAFNGTSSQLLRAASSVTSLVGRITNLPDATNGSDVGHGFTCTGITAAPDGTWWIANHGRPTSGSVATWAPSLVHLSADFTTKLDEIALVPLYATMQSVQGIAYDTSDDSIWITDYANNAIRHVGTLPTGAKIAGDEITGLAYAPNGLAYDAVNDRLYVGQEAASAINIYNAATGASVSSTNVTTTGGGNPGTRDHLWFDVTNGVLWMTEGANSASGNVGVWVAGRTFYQNLFTLAEADAIEGIFVRGNKLIVCSDGYYHGTSSGVNRVIEYTIPVNNYSTTLDFFFVGSVPATTGTDCIFALNDPLGGGANPTACGFGVYPTSTTGINIFVNTGASGTTERDSITPTGLPSLTSSRIIYVRVDMTALTLTLWIDGTQQSTGSLTHASRALVNAGLAAMGTASDAASRFCQMNVSAIGWGLGAIDREKIEGWAAWTFGLTGNLAATHRYKGRAP